MMVRSTLARRERRRVPTVTDLLVAVLALAAIIVLGDRLVRRR